MKVRLNDGTEENQPLRLAEGHVEAFKDVFSSDEIETYAEAGRKANGGAEFDRPQLDGQAADINRNLAAVSYRDQHIGLACEADAETFRIHGSEETQTRTGVDVAPVLTPSSLSFDVKRNDRSGKFPAEESVLKSYRAQLKSSGLGIGRPVGITPGCFRRASLSKGTRSIPTNNSPSATTAYWPAYLSTSSLKCRRTHSRSSIFFVRLPFFVFITWPLFLKSIKKTRQGQGPCPLNAIRYQTKGENKK